MLRLRCLRAAIDYAIVTLLATLPATITDAFAATMFSCR